MGISPSDHICLVALRVPIAVDAVAIVPLTCRAAVLAVAIMTVTLGATHKTVVGTGAAAVVVIAHTLPLRDVVIVVGMAGVAMRQRRRWRLAVSIPDAPPTFFLAVALSLCVIWRRRR